MVGKICVKNGEVATKLMKYFMSLNLNGCVYGRQGSGKNTVVLNMLEHKDSTQELCIITDYGLTETKFKFTDRQVTNGSKLSVNTPFVVGYNLKATDTRIVDLIETAAKVNANTLFAYESVDVADVIDKATTSVQEERGIEDRKEAEKLVLEQINYAIHVDYTDTGIRYISKISEILPCNTLGTATYRVNDLVVFDVETLTYTEVR